jgi:diaminobutyrate-2-oxoglutarate transaminase
MMLGIDVGDGAVAKSVVANCFENGLLLGACGTGGRVVKLIPPLTIEQDDLAQGMSIVIDAVKHALETS